MSCLTNACKPKCYFWPGAYPWRRERSQTDSDTVPSVLLPSWYVNILSVQRWEAADGKAAWERQSWERGFCTARVKTRMAKGSAVTARTLCPVQGSWVTPLPTWQRKEDQVPEDRLWLPVLPPSWAGKAHGRYWAGALTQPSSPNLWQTDALIKKKNWRTNPIFSDKVIDLQAQEFLVGLDHCCKILLWKYPRYVPSPARTVRQNCSQLPRLGSQLHRGKSRANPQDSKNQQYEVWDWKRRFREL